MRGGEVGRRRRERLRQLGRDDDMGGRGDRDAMGERLAGEIRIEQRNDAANLRDAKPDREIFRPVGHQQADADARLDALGDRPSGIAVHSLRKRCEAHRLPVAEQRRLVAKRLAELADYDGQGPPGIVGGARRRFEGAHPGARRRRRTIRIARGRRRGVLRFNHVYGVAQAMPRLQSRRRNLLRQWTSAGSPSLRRTAATRPITIAWVWRSSTSSTSQSMQASASRRSGAPVTSDIQLDPSKRAAPLTPLRPAKRSARLSCPPPRIFTPNVLLIRSEASVADALVMHTSSEGGSSESEHSDVAVQPVRAKPWPVVTRVTPLANSRMARRKAAPPRSDVAPLIRSVRASKVELSK